MLCLQTCYVLAQQTLGVRKRSCFGSPGSLLHKHCFFENIQCRCLQNLSLAWQPSLTQHSVIFRWYAEYVSSVDVMRMKCRNLTYPGFADRNSVVHKCEPLKAFNLNQQMLLFSVRLGIIQCQNETFRCRYWSQISLQLNALKMSSYKDCCTVHLPKPNSRLLIQSSRIQTR